MNKEIKKLYLINSKPEEEPSFSNSVIKTSQERDVSCIVCNSEEFSYYIPSELAKDIDIYHNGMPIEDLSASVFFIRSWVQRKIPTALLSLALHKYTEKIIDHEANSAHEIINSKIAQAVTLKGSSARFPNTWLCTANNAVMLEQKITDSLGETVVLKARGGRGETVWKLSSTDAIKKAAYIQESSKYANQVFVFQEVVKNDHDIRAIVYKDKVLVAIKRSATDGFYNNVARGATASIVELDDSCTEVALAAAHNSNLDMAGVDIVLTNKGPMIFEVNKTPDVESFSKELGVDIAGIITDAILDDLG